MAENNSDEVVPIKVVFASEDDYFDPTGSVRDFDALCNVTTQLRKAIQSKVDSVAKAFAPAFSEQPDVPAVAKVSLKELALAKSFRPSEVFNDKSCPIIGVEGPGELLVSVSPKGLKSLEVRLENTAKRNTAHISTIEDIKPYSFDDAFHLNDISKTSPKKQIGFRLFHHKTNDQNSKIEKAFVSLATECGVQNLKPIRYTDSMTIFVGDNVTASAAQALARFVGTQSVGEVPEHGLVRQQSIIQRSAAVRDLPPPQPGTAYGLVGLLDSGTDAQNKQLQAWVVERDEYWVPAADQDNTHGSFLAGLIVNGKALNHKSEMFPATASKIIDVVTVPKNGKIKEPDLIQRIDYALKKYPQVVVWNLSLALIHDPRKLDVISDLGSALDERSRKHGVLFVVPTGNFNSTPYRHWPPQKDFGDTDLMRAPGDSMRSITVGGMAHAHNPATCVKTGDVSPFSMRGPGFGGSIKPELHHVAGNASEDGRYAQTGILSVDGMNLVEDIGVSFAVPCVSTIAAKVASELQTAKAKADITLLKGLMVHSAFINNPPLSADNVEYTGIGKCREAEEVLNCKRSSATFIFQIPVNRSPEFYKKPFPMPPCLEKSGAFQGEVFMTLIYDPPMDKNYTIEYVRTNITASLGAVRIDEETGDEKYSREVNPVPKNLRGRYPASLVKLGLDWSPMKLYWRRFTKLEAGLKWRLKLERVDRAEWGDKDPQNVHLIVTIKSLGGIAVDIYTEMLRAMRELSWKFQNLEIRSRARGRN